MERANVDSQTGYSSIRISGCIPYSLIWSNIEKKRNVGLRKMEMVEWSIWRESQLSRMG